MHLILHLIRALKLMQSGDTFGDFLYKIWEPWFLYAFTLGATTFALKLQMNIFHIVIYF